MTAYFVQNVFNLTWRFLIEEWRINELNIQLIETSNQFKQIAEESKEFFLLKHSLTCPISAEAKREYEAFSQQANLPLYILHVQDSRSLSNEIADRYGIKHQSPQVLYFQNNEVKWNTSHWNITNKELNKLVQS